MADHTISTEQARRIDTVLRWWDRLGRHLRLTTPRTGRRSEGGGGGMSHIGKLNSALSSTDTVGVTFTVWTTDRPAVATTETIDNVTASELLTPTGTFASSSAVRIKFEDGNWKVVGAPCT